MTAENKIILATERLILREMNCDDIDALRQILGDKETMYAYEHAFDEKEITEWLNNQLRRYREDGFGLWAVVLRTENKMIGQCGLTFQEIPDGRVLEVGYLFNKNYWHKGYASEAAAACRDYAFNTLKAEKVYSIIRDNNFASQKVARRTGMRAVGTTVKNYYGMNMPHLLYCLDKKI